MLTINFIIFFLLWLLILSYLISGKLFSPGVALVFGSLVTAMALWTGHLIGSSVNSGAATAWWGAVLVLLFLKLLGAHSAEEEESRNRLLEKVAEVSNRHALNLAIARRQMVRIDRYGVADERKWQKEVAHFVEKVVVPVTGPLPANLEAEVRKCVETAAASSLPAGVIDGELSPVEYEHAVCSLLTDCGWQARVTKGSGDQGVDVVASKGGKSVALQCKLHSRPVGNAAVQEVIGGKAFYKTGYAAVVSNAGYTPAARELAAAAGILLLHHDELPGLEARLAGEESAGRDVTGQAPALPA